MDVSDTVGVQINDLVGGVGDARLLHGGRVCAEFVHQSLKALRHEGARQLDGALHLISTRDGHNTGDDGHRDACLADLIKKIIEQVVIEEHLGGQKFTARVHLLLEIADVLLLIEALGVNLGIAGTADAEVRTAFLQLPHQIHGVSVRPGASVLVETGLGNISAKCQHVLDARFADGGNLLLHRLAGR